MTGKMWRTVKDFSRKTTAPLRKRKRRDRDRESLWKTLKSSQKVGRHRLAPSINKVKLDRCEECSHRTITTR
ncbi:hypothetical protein AOLI_G00024590 [Acnodon oligacanthus]